VVILGLLGVLLGGGTLLVSLLLPTLTDGRTSWDEAIFGIIPGAIVLALSFIVATLLDHERAESGQKFDRHAVSLLVDRAYLPPLARRTSLGPPACLRL
jgi:hypothetical protein